MEQLATQSCGQLTEGSPTDPPFFLAPAPATTLLLSDRLLLNKVVAQRGKWRQGQ